MTEDQFQQRVDEAVKELGEENKISILLTRLNKDRIEFMTSCNKLSILNTELRQSVSILKNQRDDLTSLLKQARDHLKRSLGIKHDTPDSALVLMVELNEILTVKATAVGGTIFTGNEAVQGKKNDL